MRADLVGLGVRLEWVSPEAAEEPAFAIVMERLRDDGKDILLIFDNAIDADSVEPFFPMGGDAQILVTSNAHVWRDVASPMQIDIWPRKIGADYLVSRTGRASERQAALDLSNVLGGLPLAHEQAAAYCERLEVSFATYQKRYDAAPVDILDDTRDAPRAYHNRLTVAKTFALAVDEAAKLHPAAEPLLVYAAMLAPEPIPLFLLSEARETFSEPFASALADDGLDEAIAALRAFALVDREKIPDERDPTIVTDCIRLHRLVRQVAGARCEGKASEGVRSALFRALTVVYPRDIFSNPKTWPLARRVDPLVLGLVDSYPLPDDAIGLAANLLGGLALYRHVLGAYAEARNFHERALAIHESLYGPEHPTTGVTLNNLGHTLHQQGNFTDARLLFERALAIVEKERGLEHPETAIRLNNLAIVLKDQKDFAVARSLYERALAIDQKMLGPDHTDTAIDHGNLAGLLYAQGDFSVARQHVELALGIFEKVLGSDHPTAATSLVNLGLILEAQGDLGGALLIFERGLSIRRKIFGPEHPLTKNSAIFVAKMLHSLGRVAEAATLRSEYQITA